MESNLLTNHMPKGNMARGSNKYSGQIWNIGETGDIYSTGVNKWDKLRFDLCCKNIRIICNIGKPTKIPLWFSDFPLLQLVRMFLYNRHRAGKS